MLRELEQKAKQKEQQQKAAASVEQQQAKPEASEKAEDMWTAE